MSHAVGRHTECGFGFFLFFFFQTSKASPGKATSVWQLCQKLQMYIHLALNIISSDLNDLLILILYLYFHSVP